MPPGDPCLELSSQRYARAYRDVPVCVTGGAGFIGGHLTRALAELGARVTVIDDLSNGRESNLEPVRDRIRFVRGSILDDNVLHEALNDMQIVFHQAAITSVPRSVQEPALFHDVNATGTLRVLERARATRARVIYAASSSAYGEQADEEKIETMCPRPMSPYAASKLAGEHLLRAYAHCYGLPGLSLRYFNIFGPGQRADSPYAAVIPIFADLMLRRQPPMIYGDGAQTRDFTHISNAMHANLLAGVAEPDRLTGDVVNIACGESYAVLAVAQRIARHLGAPDSFRFAPPRVGEVQHSRASITKARRMLGYEPVTRFEAGLEDTLRSIAPARKRLE